MPGIFNTKKFKGASWRKFTFAFIWAILIIALSLMPSNAVPKIGWSGFFGFDKIVHLVIYAVLSISILYPLFRLNGQVSKNNVLAVILFCSALGGLLELGQGFFFWGRSFELLDIIANIIGSIIGFYLFRAYLKILY